MKKSMVKKLVLIVIFLVGGLLFTYPFYSNGINYFVDQYRLKELSKINEKEQLEKVKKMEEINQSIKVNGLVIDHDPFDASQVETTSIALTKHLIGSIRIPKIDVSIPLFDTLTDQVLENGAGVLQGTSMPTGGKGNHSVLSAHRGLAERLLFRHLDKLENGDIFLIESVGKTLAYKVDEIKTVKPEETNFIKPNSEKDLISLLTCTPYMINSHRLIVTGKRVEITDEMTNSIDTSQKKQRWQQAVILISIIVSLLVVIILIYRVIKNYLISQNRYQFTFYVCTNDDSPLINQEFVIYRKSSNQLLKREGNYLIPVSQKNGRVTIKDLPGGIYRLALRENPRRSLGTFGVKKIKETKMRWLKTTSHSVNIKIKSRRIWLILPKEKNI